MMTALVLASGCAREAKPPPTCWLLVKAAPPSILPNKDDKFDEAEFERYKRVLIELIKGPPVVNTAVLDRSIQDLPVIKQHKDDLNEWLSNQLAVESKNSSEFISISLNDVADRNQAAEIINSVAVAFMKEVVDKERSDKLVRRDNLDRKFRTYKTQVLEKERQLFELQQQLASRDLLPAASQKQLDVSHELLLEARRAATQAELKAALATKRAEAKGAPEAEIKAARAEADAAQIEKTFWEKNAEKLSSQIESLEKDQARKQTFNGDADQLREEIEQLKGVIRDMGVTLTHWNIELDAESRVRIQSTAGL